MGGFVEYRRGHHVAAEDSGTSIEIAESARKALTPTAAILLLLFVTSPAAAQELVEEEEPPPVYVAELRAPGRAVLGLDFGIGLVDAVCSGCYAEGGLSLDLFAGLQATRRVALLAEAWSLAHLLASDGGSPGIATLVLATAGARIWLMPRLWIQAGVGGGWLLIAGSGAAADSDRVDFGPGVVIAVGGEPGHKRRSGIDLSLRIGGAALPDDDGGDQVLVYNIAAAAGFHWN